MKKIIIPIILLLILFLGVVTYRNITLNKCCAKPVLAEDFERSSLVATYEGQKIAVPETVFENNLPPKPLAVLGTSTSEKWIEISLSEQKLRAWEGSNLYLESLVSTGLPYFPTPKGEFRIWAKVRATRMEGGTGRYYYNLPNVPYVMFFENDLINGYRGYGLHGTYWHNDFGKVHSHGCVNLPTPVAEKLYYWTSPVMPEGKFYLRASADNPGTRIIIHD